MFSTNDQQITLETYKNPLDLEAIKEPRFDRMKEDEKEIDKENDEFKSLDEGIDENVGNEWDIEDDIVLPESEVKENKSERIESSSNVIIPKKSIHQSSARTSNCPAVLISAGLIEEALELLKRRIGLINTEPIRDLVEEIYGFSSLIMPNFAGLSNLKLDLMRNKKNFPIVSVNHLESDVKVGYKFTTEGKFAEAVEQFTKILRKTALVAAQSEAEKSQITSIRRIAMEYILALKCELTKRNEGVIRN